MVYPSGPIKAVSFPAWQERGVAGMEREYQFPCGVVAPQSKVQKETGN